MGILRKEFVAEDCLLGIWSINESFEELFALVDLTTDEIETVNSFQSHQRKLEWLSVRALMNNVLEKNCRIIYNSDRKPFLADATHNISISHSGNLTSVLVSKNHKVGIDLEFMTHKIHNIAHKFINEEKEKIQPDNERLHLYIHWCAKEALYKICDKQDINFKQNLFIQPFVPDNKGALMGIVDNVHGYEIFSMEYFILDGYAIVWCNK